MEKTENEHGCAGIRLEPEPSGVGAKVIKGLVHHGKADNGIDQIGTDLGTAEHAVKQGSAMPNGKQRDLKAYILHAVQKENNAKQEQQMIVACDHMFGTQIHERDQVLTTDTFNERRIALRNTASPCTAGDQRRQST